MGDRCARGAPVTNSSSSQGIEQPVAMLAFFTPLSDLVRQISGKPFLESLEAPRLEEREAAMVCCLGVPPQGISKRRRYQSSGYHRTFTWWLSCFFPQHLQNHSSSQRAVFNHRPGVPIRGDRWNPSQQRNLPASRFSPSVIVKLLSWDA